MSIKSAVFVTSLSLSLLALVGCGTEPHDAIDLLERPPQTTIVTPTEEAAVSDINIATNGLGDKIKLIGKDVAPLIKITESFDNAWLLLGKTLKFNKIKIVDHDREKGLYFVNFEASGNKSEPGFFSSLTGNLFSDALLRRYQIRVKQSDKSTWILAKDLGALTTAANAKEGVEEAIDPTVKAPEHSEFQLMSKLYKSLKDGFVEPENQQKKGFFD